MGLEVILSKFLKNFLTSLIIFYSKKLIFYIDGFFSNVSTANVIVCSSCGEDIHIEVIRRMGRMDYCPHCRAKLEKDEMGEINEQR